MRCSRLLRGEKNWELYVPQEAVNEGNDFSSLVNCYDAMPAISIFFGIVIKMYYDDHRPPHFHADYQGQKGAFDFSGRQLAGNMGSKVALRLIKEWAVRQKHEFDGSTVAWLSGADSAPETLYVVVKKEHNKKLGLTSQKQRRSP